MEFVPGEDLKKLIRKSGRLAAGRPAKAVARLGEKPEGWIRIKIRALP